MEKLNLILSQAVPLPLADIDTDQIIPAQYLKATTREGFGDALFSNWRYDSKGNPQENFVLNSTLFKGSILLAGKNFGCGSSREHAAWALYDYGFRVVISDFFADIFKGNALNNGLLPIELKSHQMAELFDLVYEDHTLELEVDLPHQIVRVPKTQKTFDFEIDAYKKMCLLNGYDDIDFLLSKMEEIIAFENQQQPF